MHGYVLELIAELIIMMILAMNNLKLRVTWANGKKDDDDGGDGDEE